MKSFAVLALTVILAVTLVPAALAQQPENEQFHLHLDPASTEVHFTLKDTLHTVRGSFHLSAGDIVFNARTGEAHGLFSVECGSGASGNDTRDGRMKNELLEAPKFPLATFEPQKVTGFNPAPDAANGARKISVAGNMTIHGTSRPMTLEFTVSQSGAATTATTHFIIPYVDWGIKDPSIPFVKVEKQVAMDVVAKGTLTQEK
jgi:polyisoprenoid-binding protein YceI